MGRYLSCAASGRTLTGIAEVGKGPLWKAPLGGGHGWLGEQGQAQDREGDQELVTSHLEVGFTYN